MLKSILCSLIVISITTACSYNPVQYEQKRIQDNAEHDKQGR